ncbi:hypothetical protein ACWJJH_04930 [Endozoicomonadaceae bacterium StTr2]
MKLRILKINKRCFLVLLLLLPAFCFSQYENDLRVFVAFTENNQILNIVVCPAKKPLEGDLLSPLLSKCKDEQAVFVKELASGAESFLFCYKDSSEDFNIPLDPGSPEEELFQACMGLWAINKDVVYTDGALLLGPCTLNTLYEQLYNARFPDSSCSEEDICKLGKFSVSHVISNEAESDNDPLAMYLTFFLRPQAATPPSVQVDKEPAPETIQAEPIGTGDLEVLFTTLAESLETAPENAKKLLECRCGAFKAHSGENSSVTASSGQLTGLSTQYAGFKEHLKIEESDYYLLVQYLLDNSQRLGSPVLKTLQPTINPDQDKAIFEYHKYLLKILASDLGTDPQRASFCLLMLNWLDLFRSSAA